MEDEIVRKKCVQCGQPIVGVIPKWVDGQPVCRDCTYKFPKAQVRAVKDSESAGRGKDDAGAQGGRRRRILWAFAILLMVAAALGAVRLFSSVVFAEKPLHRGDVTMDRLGDECVKNLWNLSKALQEGKLGGLSLNCPASGRPYRVTDLDGDTVISCPTPGTHKVTSLKVSRSNPIPEVVR